MSKLLGAFIYLRARLAEPSTHASLIGLLAMFHQQLPEEAIQDAMNVAALGFGMLGFFVPEAKALTVVK